MINITDFTNVVNAVWGKYGKKCELSPDQLEIFRKLTVRLLEENEKYNLTAIRTVEGVVENHIFDSILPAALIPEGASLLDVGSGAGFPSLPLAIIRPDIKVTALDSTEKKVEYIRTTAELLGLENVSTLYGRAEELSLAPFEERAKSEMREKGAKKSKPAAQEGEFLGLRESFDVVIARSVAAFNLLSELCVPFLKVGGTFIAMKGEKALHEAKEGENALYLLGCVQKCEIVKPYTIDPELDKLFFVSVKRSKTPAKYPRKYAQIKKKPL